jgi:iron-sulfur cluster repair protein YtfE (RIC family)
MSMRKNDHPPLKRDESLQPFSRDHFMGLKAANRLTQAVAADDAEKCAAAAYFHQCWDAEIADHFREEEQLLIPLMLDSEIQQMRQEHDSIRNLVATDRQRHGAAPPAAHWCSALGRELHDHIRWEERTLFGAIQDRATPTQLAAVGKATAEIEKRRPGLRIRGSGPRKKLSI